MGRMKLPRTSARQTNNSLSFGRRMQEVALPATMGWHTVRESLSCLLTLTTG